MGILIGLIGIVGVPLLLFLYVMWFLGFRLPKYFSKNVKEQKPSVPELLAFIFAILASVSILLIFADGTY